MILSILVHLLGIGAFEEAHLLNRLKRIWSREAGWFTHVLRKKVVGLRKKIGGLNEKMGKALEL